MTLPGNHRCNANCLRTEVCFEFDRCVRRGSFIVVRIRDPWR